MFSMLYKKPAISTWSSLRCYMLCHTPFEKKRGHKGASLRHSCDKIMALIELTTSHVQLQGAAWLGGGLIQPIASNKIVKKKNHLPQIKGIHIDKSLKPPPKCLFWDLFFLGDPVCYEFSHPFGAKFAKAPSVWGVAFLLPHVEVESPWPGQESRGHLCVKPHVWKVKVYRTVYIYMILHSNPPGWLLSSHISI